MAVEAWAAEALVVAVRVVVEQAAAAMVAVATV